jgi:2,5-diamino-6-(ribosylamino)-4(3H)-pyrimidinone 5'-phosphate reductase
VTAPTVPPAAARRATVWVNCAVSADGRLALAGGTRATFSGPNDLARVQRLRSEVDAVLVGVGTVVRDDPSLRVHWDQLGRPPGREPWRIVVDSTGRTPEAAKVLDGRQPTLIATTPRSRRTFPAQVRTIVVGDQEVDLAVLFQRLPELGIRTVLVEGGARILASVARAGLFDRWSVFYAPRLVGGATAPSMLAGPESPTLDATVGLRLDRVERMDDGLLAHYLPAAAPGP